MKEIKRSGWGQGQETVVWGKGAQFYVKQATKASPVSSSNPKDVRRSTVATAGGRASQEDGSEFRGPEA